MDTITEAHDTKLRQLEHQFCEAVDLYVDPVTFDGRDCNDCIVGQIGYAIGAFIPVPDGNMGTDKTPNGLSADDDEIPFALAEHMAKGRGLSEEDFTAFVNKVTSIYNIVVGLNYWEAKKYAYEVMRCLTDQGH